MKTQLAVYSLSIFLAVPALAQTTGTAHPEELNDSITTTAPAPKPLPATAKPSPDIPMPADDSHYVPLHQREATPAPAPMEASAQTPPSHEARYAEPSFKVTDDPNSGIVTEVPSGPNELPIGTLIRARLHATVSTKTTRAGTHFTAVLSRDVEAHHKVMIPTGSILEGRITEVRGGHRFGGGAAIRFQPDRITLPDGTHYHLDADVIDLAHFHDAHVNDEGTIVSNEHPKATLAAFGLTTGSAAVAGAMIGGGVGAVVGAGIGAGAGAVLWFRRDHQATLPQDTELIFSLNSSLQMSPTTY